MEYLNDISFDCTLNNNIVCTQELLRNTINLWTSHNMSSSHD